MKKIIYVIFAIILLFTACAPRTGKGLSESEAPAADASIPEPPDVSSGIGTDSGAASPEPAVSGEAAGSSDTPPLTFTLVVPEGYTLARIGMVLEDKGVCTADEFIAAAQNGDFSDYPLIARQTPSTERCFSLEGYLFPDTYDIYFEDSPEAIIRRMLEHTEQKIGADLRSEIDASGYTADEIISMASIIEKEAFGSEHMPAISSVLHNRLDIGMRLQCDVTITYVEGAIKPFISGDKDRFNSFYNTYKCPGLPAGAICNPGLSAIKAALRPADTDYLFFVTDSENNYYYAATWEEHEKNVAVAMG